MPLSTICVSTVSNRPRLWSSQTNIRIKDNNALHLATMNSTEEISLYKSPQEFYPSPTFSKRTTLGHSYDFPEKSAKKEKKWSIGSLFRRKKKEESESSSEEEQKKGFLGRRRRKSDGKRRKPKTVGGFDHIVLPKTQHPYNGYNHHEDTGILSDPSGGFSNYIGRSQAVQPQSNFPQPHSNSFNNSVVSVASVGSGDSISKKKGRELVKARAIARRTTLGNESSSDDDSNSSLRIRSDESLAKHFHDAAHSKRSRAARTERYLKRHSKDGESPHNYLRLSKSDADEHRSPSRSPANSRPYPTSISGSQTSNMSGLSTIPPSHGIHGKYRVSNSTSNPSYKPPLSMNDYNNAISSSKNVAFELDKSGASQRSVSCDGHIHQEDVLHVQFPILRPHNRGYRNLSLIDSALVSNARQPPQPPPRDPNRTVSQHHFESGRPSTVYFDSNSSKLKSYNRFLQPKMSSRSTSEVHIPNDPFQIACQVRPASTTPEVKPNKYSSRSRHTVDGFNYLADKKPRSRKPIVIQSNAKIEPRKDSPTQKALDFWKQIEDSVTKACPKTPQIFTSKTHVQSQVFIPEPSRPASPFKPISPTAKDEVKRKSANLEEALHELETIYNSLRLGDENLLDRAEQRENETLVKRAEERKKQVYGCNRGALSDSSFSYEPFDQVDSPKRKKVVKKGRLPDTKGDDMYNRKLAKEKSATISDPQSVSYLLASPVHQADDSEGELKNVSLPDVKYDDLVYRNVKRANASPKTVDPQPPFGIPLGPVAPAPNSDYLHATPGTIYTPAYIPKKIPDIVKDDLAFRNLRKDSNKEPVLPPALQDQKLDLNYLKKRRAVRSLSANIGNILGKDVKDSEEDEFKSKTLTDIADAMEIARRVLKEKGKNINDTYKAFMSDTEVKPSYVSKDSFKESRLKFLNGLKDQDKNNVLVTRPPKGLTPERKIPRSPTTTVVKEGNGSTHSSLDDLLNALAEEAKVTTERITRELKELEEKRLKEQTDLTEDLKPCQKLLKAVVIEYSKSPCEVVEEINIPSPPAESANVVQSCFKDSSEERQLASDEHDYETIDSCEDKIDVNMMEKEVEREKCQSPFEERKAELVASFQELKNDIDEIKIPAFDAKKTDSIYDNLEDAPQPSNADEGEHKFDACRVKELPPSNLINSRFVVLKRFDFEHPLESLKSPKLVLETSKNRTSPVPKSSHMILDLSRSSSSNDLSRPGTSGTASPARSTHDRDEEVDYDPHKPGQLWYHDPAKVAVACSYGIACAHQLASIDLVAVLSLLFAVMSFIVALFL